MYGVGTVRCGSTYSSVNCTLSAENDVRICVCISHGNVMYCSWQLLLRRCVVFKSLGACISKLFRDRMTIAKGDSVKGCWDSLLCLSNMVDVGFQMTLKRCYCVNV